MSKIRYERWECDKCGGRVNVKASNPYIPYCDDCGQERFLVSVEMEPKPKKRFTSSSLKALYEGNEANIGLHYFTRPTMEYFGDTMRNYGVRKVLVYKSGYHNKSPINVWELYRINPVKFGFQGSDYFSLAGLHLVDVHQFHPEEYPS